MADPAFLKQLIERPLETLEIELKTWLNLTINAHIAKLVPAMLALYNRGGGTIVIGINDKTRKPDTCTIDNVRAHYHPDKIQILVSRYSFQPFVVEVDFVEYKDVTYPVITVPGGIRTPTAIAADLHEKVDGKITETLLKHHEVYYRTTRTNGLVSTAPVTKHDWDEIIRVCFNNREADIGNFVRRHLTPNNLADLAVALGRYKEEFFVPPSKTLVESVQETQERGRERMKVRLRERGLGAEEEPLANWGYFEVAAVIEGIAQKFHVDQPFYYALSTAAPRKLDWPTWVDMMPAEDKDLRPVPAKGGWETLMIIYGSWIFDHFDFIRSEPEGRFYFRRALDDDSSARRRGTSTHATLDPGIVVSRVADAIATMLAFARAMGAQDGKIGMEFTWNGLKGRSLSAWASQLVIFPGAHLANDDDARAYAEVAVDISPSSIYLVVEEVVRELTNKFDGFIMPTQTIERRTNEVLRIF